ncbi:MAG: hypothetical protein NTU84_00125 [Verrucomicrobia bacterium]|nr:hypothetical protein [Verrucomicrobiota bacterium]
MQKNHINVGTAERMARLKRLFRGINQPEIYHFHIFVIEAPGNLLNVSLEAIF